MARQVLPIVGAVIGGIYGGPAGAQAGYMIGSIIGNAVDPQIIKGPKLGEAGLQTSAEGVFRPIVFGTGAVKGNIICRGNRQVKKKRERQGKGGPVTETERVYWTWAIRICEGPVAGILRIWQDEKLVYDVRPDSEIVEESTEFAEKMRLYLGDETQLPDPDLEAFKGVGNVPAYRGTCYAVFPNFDLTDTGERIPEFRFEVASVAFTAASVPVFAAGVGSSILLKSVSGGDLFDDEIDSGIDPGANATLVESLNGKLFHFSELGNARVSVDAGQTWQSMVGLPTDPIGYRAIVAAIYMDADGLDGARYIFFPSDDYATDWYYSIDGINCFPNPDYPTDALSQPKYCAASRLSVGLCGQGTGYIGRTIDAGHSWTQFQALPGVGNSINHLVNTGTRFVAASSIDNTRLLLSDDGSDGTWTEVDFPGRAPSAAIHGLAYGDGRLVVSLSSGDTAYSDDDGDTWSAGASTGAQRILGAGNALIFSGGYFIGACGAQYQIIASPDGVAAWSLVYNDPITGVNARSLAPADQAASVVQGEPIPLSLIVSTLCSRPGLASSRYDVVELTDLVDGLVLADDYTYADAIRTLMPIYFFGASEHDAGTGYKLHFPMHGKAVVTTLTIEDFVDVPDKTVRQDAYERPRVLHLHYQSPTVGYAPAKASPTRFSPDVKVVGEQSVQVPVSFKSQDEAWQRADKLLKIVWTGIAGEEEFSLPMSFLYLVPTDAVGISLRGQVRRMVFADQSYAAGVIQSKLVSDRQGNYTSTLTGIPLPPPTPPPPSIVGPTLMAFGDWPALNDNNDRLLYYIGATGQTEAWHGAQVDRSTDGGSNFVEAVSFGQNTIMGTLQDPITAASRYYTDTTNVIRVRLYMDDEIESLSEAQFSSEGGAFMLKSAIGWEMLQYRDAEQDSNGDWLLTHLKRGQLNTAPDAHDPGSLFVLLDAVKTVDAVTAWLNTDLTHRATSTGRSPDGVPTQTDQFTGASQREFPVASVSLSRNVDEITVTIIPRHRFGTESNPIRSINWERYTIEISDGLSVSVLGTTSDTYTFDAAGMASPIQVAVAQRNRLTGDGPFVAELIA